MGAVVMFSWVFFSLISESMKDVGPWRMGFTASEAEASTLALPSTSFSSSANISHVKSEQKGSPLKRHCPGFLLYPEILAFAVTQFLLQPLWALGNNFCRYSAAVSTGQQLPQILGLSTSQWVPLKRPSVHVCRETKAHFCEGAAKCHKPPL